MKDMESEKLKVRSEKSDRVKGLLTRYATPLFLFCMAIFSGICLYVGFNYYIEFSAFSVVIAMVTIILALVSIIDKVFLPGINILEELKDGNIAVAIWLLAIAVLIHACVGFV